MDFQTCAVERVQTQSHEVGVAYVSGTLGNFPSDLPAYCVQNLWNISTENISAKVIMEIMEQHAGTRAKWLSVYTDGQDP
jgi:hypothetical protein